MRYVIAIALLIAVSGCVSQTASNNGLVVTLSADPPRVFQNQATTLFIDIDNTDVKKLNNVIFELFDAGIMEVVDGPQVQQVTQSVRARGDLQYTVKQGDVLWNIVKNMYGLTDNTQIANKVNEIVSHNSRLNDISIDNKKFETSGDPSTLVECETGPCDGIRGDVIYPGDVIALPGLGEISNQETIQVSGCRKSFSLLKPDEFQTFSCKLKAGEVQESMTSTVNAKTTFSAELDAVQLIELISRQEYERRQAAGTFYTLPREYTYSDNNIALDIEFSEDLPVIERSNKRYFIHLTIRNAGDGFVEGLEPGEFLIFQGTDVESQLGRITKEQIGANIGEINRIIVTTPQNLITCNRLDEKLSPLGKTFPRITCELIPPDNIDVIGNYPMGIKIAYDYETRQSLGIRIIK